MELFHQFEIPPPNSDVSILVAFDWCNKLLLKGEMRDGCKVKKSY
jgi:hypothetical protein